ncbi:unnamed protein product [Ilex paraguariensis]|uniref:Polygalacturonase n=1 Tax=Ilex paraguariensis TaxID=185542 RepID=A0ABC8TCY9_9AQUA
MPKAFLQAWAAACRAAIGTPVLCIPEGYTFLLSPTTFQGPCTSPNINVQIDGNIVAPSDPRSWTSLDLHNWLAFSKISGLVIDGTGRIDGQGSGLGLYDCDNLQLSGLTHINSPRDHINIVGCTGLTISNLHIIAPDLSPTTDGINIGKSDHIEIHDSIIATGDDCIAIGGESTYINVTGIECGPGHGISIGSLGANGMSDTVEEVHVKNCSFTGTMFAARIKTWQGGSEYARHISFEDITLVAAGTPILIDQYYCISTPNCKNQISDVFYTNVRGTSSTDVAIKLSCSETAGCTNIVLNNIDITSIDDPTHITSSSCLNAHGTSSLTNPVVDCLIP